MKQPPSLQTESWNRVAAHLFETLPDSMAERIQRLEDMIIVVPHQHPLHQKVRDLLAHLVRHQLLQKELSLHE